MTKKEPLIVLCAYNEEKIIAKVIKQVKKEGYKEIVVIDDASKDKTYEKAKQTGVNILKHPINRGHGGATSTGLEYAKRNGYNYVVFLDSDGQHDPKDIKKLLKVAPNYDVVIGSRMVGNKDMPLNRRIINKIGSLVTWVFFGLYVKDSQSGFKIFNKKAIESITISFDRYEFCSEIIGEIYKKNLSYKEVPIKVIYNDYSLSKGQNFLNGVKMVLRFLFKN